MTPLPRLGAPLLAVLAAVAMSACAPLVPSVPAMPAVERQAATAFELEGRMSASDGNRAASGRVEWRHDAQRDEWTVYTPLGQIAARLESDAAGARLTEANGRRTDAAALDVLLPRVLGVEVPTARLGDWVQAVPGATAEVRKHDALGRPALVFDQGWRIDYLDYASTRPDARPTRLDISRGEARIRLFVNAWTLHP